MNREEFVEAFFNVLERAMIFSKKRRYEGFLTLEKMIDEEKAGNRDIFEYGMRFVVDGVDAWTIRDMLENIAKQEKDEYIRLLKNIQLEAVLSIQAGENPRITLYKMNAFTDIPINDPRFNKWLAEKLDKKIAAKDIQYPMDEFFPTEFFDLFLKLDDRSIVNILREIDSQWLAIVLIPASDSDREAIFKKMSHRAVTMIIEDMEYVGPVCKERCAKAQEQILSIIRHLEDCGVIHYRRSEV